MASLPNDRSYQPDVIACCVISTVVGTVFVALRFYTRRVLINVLGVEDWFILLAQIFSILTCIFQVQEAVLGLGKHWWLVPLENVIPMGKAGYLAIVGYQLSLVFTGISIMLLYIRIWTHEYVRRAAYTLLAILILYDIFTLIIVFTACIPLQSFWDYEIPGNCHPKSYWWAIVSMHIVLDFLIFCLPMPVIFNLNCSRRQKNLLYVLFAIGFFASFISVIRVIWLVKTADSLDIPFDYVPIATWTSIETNVTVIVACLMTMKPLLSKFFPKLIGSYLRQSSGDQAGNHVLTIGSKPSRAPLEQHQQPWDVVFDGRQGSLDQRVEEMKDLEGQTTEQGRHSIGAGRKVNLRQLLNRSPGQNEWRTALEMEMEMEMKNQPANSSGDTILLQRN